MPKKIFTINDFSGGLNTDKSTRALEDNELVACKNLDPTSKGKVICSRVFKQVDGNYADQAEAGTGNAVAITAGYGLAVFANDNKVSDAATYTGEFVVKADGGAAGANFIDILEPASTWTESQITGQATTPIFYAAEGDLFCGGDHSSTPGSLIFHKQDQVPSATGDVGYDGDIKVWKPDTQAKPIPTVTDTNIFEAIGTGTTAGGMTPLTDNDLHWIIKNSGTTGGSGSTGLWTNVITGQDYYEYAASWLYKNDTESDLVEIQNHSNDASSTGDYGQGMHGATTFTDKTITIQAWINHANPTTAAVSYARYGARLYSRLHSEGGDWYLLAEMNYEKGIKGDGETEWNPWFVSNVSTGSTVYEHDAVGDHCTTGDIAAPPSLLTYKILNGHSTGDIADATPATTAKDRIVYWKTGLVANSRAYVGNVKINGRTYGDRILKSPIFQYDVFTENNYLDVAINDGDQITALAAYGDRILQFKNNAVYIINVSKELEFLEDSQKGAGVGWQAAVTTTSFGVVWINENGCYLYDGEKITQLHLEKISSSDWSGNIDSTTPKSIIGYDTVKKQIIVLWDATSGGSGESYIFDAANGSWYETDDILAHAVNCTNMVNARGDKLLIGGNAAVDDINFLADRGTVTLHDAGTHSTTTVDLQTKVFDFGNPESKKNLLEVAIVYKYGHASLDVNISADHASYVEAGSGSEGLLTTTVGPTLVEIDTSGQSDFQGKKTFQVQIEGTSDELFELHSIALTYRDLGVH